MYNNIKAKINLSRFTTWRIGGLAEYFAEPENVREIKIIIQWANHNNIPCNIIGAGSNLLINDNGVQGLTISLKKFQKKISISKKLGFIEALAGEPIPALARQAARAGLQGLEWAIGIPGTIGGGAVMNAGAQGQCMANILESIEVISLNGGESFRMTNEELKFAYRDSLLQHKKLIVISARLKLQPTENPEKILKITNQNLSHRLKTQPYNLPSCGSVFRNPEPMKAGKIIEELGLKGLRVGGAEISKKHANFIINTHNATAEDASKLIAMIQKKAKEAHGFLLKPEVKKLGFEEMN